MSIKKILVGAAASAVILGSLVVPAFATSVDEPDGQNNNEPAVQTTVAGGLIEDENDCDNGEVGGDDLTSPLECEPTVGF